MLGPGPRLMKKNLPGRGLTKVEKHWTIQLISQWPLVVPAAESWPQVFDDSAAREDWQWEHKYDMDMLVTAMIRDVRRQQEQ